VRRQQAIFSGDFTKKIKDPYFGVCQEKGNQITERNALNTANKRDKIGFAPVDLLYSESLTKST
jgi:hypothetical protein